MCISCYQPNKNSVFVPVQSRLLACVCSSCLADCDTNIVELKNRTCFRHFLCDWSRGMTFPFNFSTIFTSYIYWPCNFGLFLTSIFSTRSLYVVFSEFLVASQSQFKDTNCSKVETYQDGLVWLWITQVNLFNLHLCPAASSYCWNQITWLSYSQIHSALDRSPTGSAAESGDNYICICMLSIKLLFI